ncbi:MAG: hypothetical protein MJZ83_03355 [Bacteroidaceae bacterium]|nr:hypothetical protein [Bacteroidaceae bacterium]
MKTLKHKLTILVVTLAAFGNMAAQNVPTLTLNNGAVMPQFGIGTYNQTNDQAYAGCPRTAVSCPTSIDLES